MVTVISDFQIYHGYTYVCFIVLRLPLIHTFFKKILYLFLIEFKDFFLCPRTAQVRLNNFSGKKTDRFRALNVCVSSMDETSVKQSNGPTLTNVLNK